MSYLDTTTRFYSDVAKDPMVGLCCVRSTPLQLPGLTVPVLMQEMNYGCGTVDLVLRRWGLLLAKF